MRVWTAVTGWAGTASFPSFPPGHFASTAPVTLALTATSAEAVFLPPALPEATLTEGKGQ